ncbi:DUF5408 family protein [Helicobacter cetorum]|uniref:Uncharacterized protein n=1 Tax=Helicobacter cetorum (strain ATCC BAA-429 / MIT 00-7128) TaxID=182217 RepID=I0ELD7_HELC0|nr:DUF5408 family protein [Helicobacter cetorum]AFI03756.1 hypothetical protein HCW_02375 [Helicobacter cetorum MIT 00-7128]
MQENESLQIAKRAIKIVFFWGLLVLLLMMINIYILINQVNATAEIGKKVKQLEKATQNYEP